MLDPSSFGFWLGPREVEVSVSTPYSVPLSISPRCVLLLPGRRFEAGGVRWCGREGQQQHRATTPTTTPAAFPRPPRSAFALEPKPSRPAQGETNSDDDDDNTTTRTTNQTRPATDRRPEQTTEDNTAKGKAGRNGKGKHSSTADDKGKGPTAPLRCGP